MPPRRPVTDLERFAGPGVAAERRARRRLENAARRRAEAREQARQQSSNDRIIDMDTHRRNEKINDQNQENERRRIRNEERRRRARNTPRPTVDIDEEDMFGSGINDTHKLLQGHTEYWHKQAREPNAPTSHLEGITVVPDNPTQWNSFDWEDWSRKRYPWIPSHQLSGTTGSSWLKERNEEMKDITNDFYDAYADNQGNIRKDVPYNVHPPMKGSGWEDEMKAAVARDTEREKDKQVADQIRSAAAADSKRRIDNTSRKLH